MLTVPPKSDSAARVDRSLSLRHRGGRSVVVALACTWGGYADTDLDFSEFFAGNHTVAVRFMLQFPNAYAGRCWQ